MKETFQTPPFTNRWRKLLVFGYLEIAGELMRANCKSRSISAPDFLHKQSGTPRLACCEGSCPLRRGQPRRGFRGFRIQVPGHGGVYPIVCAENPALKWICFCNSLALVLPLFQGNQKREAFSIDS